MFMCFPAFLFFGNWWFLKCLCPPVHAGTVGACIAHHSSLLCRARRKAFVSNMCAEISKQNKPGFSSCLEGGSRSGPGGADWTGTRELTVAGKIVGVMKAELVQSSKTGCLQQAHAAAELGRSKAPGGDASATFLCALTRIVRRGAGSVLCGRCLYCGNNCSVKHQTWTGENISN